MFSFRHNHPLWLAFAFTQGICIASSYLHLRNIGIPAAVLSCVAASALLYRLQRVTK